MIVRSKPQINVYNIIFVYNNIIINVNVHFFFKIIRNTKLEKKFNFYIKRVGTRQNCLFFQKLVTI